MSLFFIEQVFRKNGFQFLAYSDGSINVEFFMEDRTKIVVDFTEVQYDVARAEAYLPAFDRPVRDMPGLCAYVQAHYGDFTLEFNLEYNRLNALAYIEQTQSEREVANFVYTCNLGLMPLSVEISNRGYWNRELVNGFLTLSTRSKLN